MVNRGAPEHFGLPWTTRTKDNTAMGETIQPAGKPISHSEIRGPAASYKHDHPPVTNVNQQIHDSRRLGQRVADRIAGIVGGWPFIITQSCILVLWICANVYLVQHYRDKAFDPYPFILLNLMLSFQAAYTGPIVMMSQNRQNEKDRLSAQSDYECNMKAEEEIRVIMEHLTHQDQILIAQDRVLAQQTALLDNIAKRLEGLSGSAQ